MLLNIWISCFPDNIYPPFGHKYPYDAPSPLNGKMTTFSSRQEVHEYFEIVYDDSIRRSPEGVGESIYLQGAFFYDLKLFLNQDIQDRIKEFSFCKSFNCPPFKSIQETPEIIVHDFIIIESEFKSIQKHSQRKANGNK